MSDHAEEVLKLVSEPSYKPKTLKALSRSLRVELGDYPFFRNEVKRLIREGKLDIAADKTLNKPDLSGLIIGMFKRSSKGFGFVRPHDSHAKDDQIYISVEGAGDASSGDEVAVKIVKRPRKPGMNVEGRIVQVVARASAAFVGTYREEDGAGLVQVDGTTFPDPIYVGDPGAKGARPGDKVAIEIVRYPTPYMEGEGVVTEILGKRGEPGVDTLTVIRAFNLPDAFDDAVLEDAREQARRFKEDDLSGRVDLRDLLTITIDPASARDFDDAISLSRDEKGFWTLGVHIADVSHFVRRRSNLDSAARDRGTSVYLPDRVLPMIPEIISNSLASLQVGHVRYTISAFLEFDPEGVPVAHRFEKTAIRVDHRFSYEEAFAIMKAPEDAPEDLNPAIVQMVTGMLELAMILRRRRYVRGSLELNLPEVEIELDAEGKVSGAHLAPHDESHQVIEEFMLAANEAAARFLTERGVGFLRRVHADPEPHKLAEFAEFARGLGVRIDLPQSRFELQRVLEETKGKPEEYAVHFGLLRSLKQAVYTPERESHYALASDDYCHFTAPIRRYPDLQVHRQLKAVIEGKKPRSHQDELIALAEHCSRTERRAETAARELIKIKLLTHLETKIGEEFHAVIVGVEEFGLFCRLIELPAEGLLHVTSLADDFYYLESGSHTLVGRRAGTRHRLGDRIKVRIARVDVDRRELDLVPLAFPITKGRPVRRRDSSPTPNNGERSPKKPKIKSKSKNNKNKKKTKKAKAKLRKSGKKKSGKKKR